MSQQNSTTHEQQELHSNNHNERHNEARQHARALIEKLGISQPEAAKQIGITKQRFNPWLNGKYTGDNQTVTIAVENWLDDHATRMQTDGLLPKEPAWVATPTSLGIQESLQYLKFAGDMGVIDGRAGIGKTKTGRHFAANNNNVWLVTVLPGNGSLLAILEDIAIAIGLTDPGVGRAKIQRAVIKKLNGVPGMLIIDEAQHLHIDALEELRGIHDLTGIAIAFMGNEMVFTQFTGGTRAVYLDRLYSRISKRHHISGIKAADIQMLLNDWGITDRASRRSLTDIAEKPGALRIAWKVLRQAAVHALGADEEINDKHIRAAWAELGAIR